MTARSDKITWRGKNKQKIGQGEVGRPGVSVNTPLTRRQELFVKELVAKDGQITLREAAINAGYTAGSAQGDIYVSKSEIRHGSIDSMSKDEVMKALEELKQSNGEVIIDITPQRTGDTDDRGEQGERVLEDDESGDGDDEPEPDGDPS